MEYCIILAKSTVIKSKHNESPKSNSRVNRQKLKTLNKNRIMNQKKTKQEILSMSKKELSAYLINITQTDICKDKEYCIFLTQVFLKSN